MFDEVSKKIRAEAPGSRALAVVGLDGRVADLVVVDPAFDSDVLTEFATLLRIAHSTSEETANGGLSEMSWRSDRSIVLMSRVTSDRFLVFFGTEETPPGRMRYLLRREARRLALGSSPSSRPQPVGPRPNGR